MISVGHWRAISVNTLVCVALAPVAGSVPALGVSDSLETADDSSFWTQANGDVIDVGWSAGWDTGDTTAGQSRPDHMQRMRAPQCPPATAPTGAPVPCPGDPVVPLVECGDAATLPMLWERPVPDALPGPWRPVGPAVCATPSDVTPAMVLAAFRRLPLTPTPLLVQPDRGWVLVNKPTVVHADARPQTLTTTILGTTVVVTATPARYAWDFGDGATLTTTDPGRPWPDATLTHTYPHTGTYRIALTTTWTATYALAGGATVRDVPGTATTTSTTAPLVVQERRSHLVAGTCADPASEPGC